MSQYPKRFQYRGQINVTPLHLPSGAVNVSAGGFVDAQEPRDEQYLRSWPPAGSFREFPRPVEAQEAVPEGDGAEAEDEIDGEEQLPVCSVEGCGRHFEKRQANQKRCDQCIAEGRR